MQAGLSPEFILFITGSEEEMQRRVLSRNEVQYYVNSIVSRFVRVWQLSAISFFGFLVLCASVFVHFLVIILSLPHSALLLEKNRLSSTPPAFPESRKFP